MIEFTRVDFPDGMYRLDPCAVFHDPDTGVVKTKQVFVEDQELLLADLPANRAFIAYSDLPGGSAMLYAVEVIDNQVTFNTTKAIEFATHYLDLYTTDKMEKAIAKDRLTDGDTAEQIKLAYNQLKSEMFEWEPNQFKALMELLQSNALYSELF